MSDIEKTAGDESVAEDEATEVEATEETTEATDEQEAAEDAPAPADAAEAEGEDEEEEEEPVPYELVSSEMKEGSVLELEFKVEPLQLEIKREEIFGDLQKETTVEGFRKGKAPINLIRARFNRAAGDEAVEAIERNVLMQHVKAEDIDVLSEPQIEPVGEVAKDEPIVFKVSMEVRPKLDEIEYGDLTAEVEQREITDATVDEQIENLRQTYASYVTVEDGVVAEDSGLVLDVEVTTPDGEKFEALSREGMHVVNFKEHLPEQVAEALMGKKAGDAVEVDVSFGAEGEEDAEKAAAADQRHYAVTIKEVQKRELPDLDDEFAKDVGEEYETLDALKADIRKRLERQEEVNQRAQALDQIFTQLEERNPFDAPQSLQAQTAQQSMREEYYQRVMSRDPEQMKDLGGEEMLDRHMESAKTYIKRMILVGEIGKAENIEVSDEDLDKEIERLAEEQGRKALAVRAQLEKQERLEELRGNLKDKVVCDFLMDKAKVTYKPAAEEKK